MSSSLLLAATVFIGCQTDTFQSSGTVVAGQTGPADEESVTLQWPGHNLQVQLNPEDWRALNRPSPYDPESFDHQELLNLQHRETGYHVSISVANPGMDLLRSPQEIYQHQRDSGDYEFASRTFREINGIQFMVLQERNTDTGSLAIQHMTTHQGLALRSWIWADEGVETDYNRLQQFADEVHKHLELTMLWHRPLPSPSIRILSSTAIPSTTSFSPFPTPSVNTGCDRIPKTVQCIASTG